MVKVVIGSANKANVEGVKRAFSILNVEEYVALPIRGFKEQPIGWTEIFLNAAKRVVEAYKYLVSIGGGGFSVGVEAGVVEYGGIMLSGQLAIVTDGEKYSVGLSGFFPLPKRFKSELLRGLALGELMTQLSRVESIASFTGAVGFFTKGYITRRELTYMATLHALIPWINREVDFELPPYRELEEILKEPKSNGILH